MAHTSDRTLLASLGFADPDKGDRRHTLACQYLCQPEVAVRLWKRVMPSLALPAPTIPDAASVPVSEGQACSPPEILTPDGLYQIAHETAQMEQAITGRNSFLIGFWDVTLKGTALRSWGWSVDRKEHGPDVHGETPPWNVHGMPTKWSRPGPVLRSWYKHVWRDTPLHMQIEVKARPVDVAAIARQIATYRNGQGDSGTIPDVVATCYPMPRADRDTLTAKGIHHVYLGPDFVAYCKARDNEASDESDAL